MAQRLGRSGQDSGPRRQAPGPNAAPRRKDRPNAIKAPVSETALHQSVAELLDWILMPPSFWTTIGHGWDKMSKAASGRLKGAGLKPGVPDIMILHPGKSCFLELKTEKGKLSRDQMDCMADLMAAGFPTYICRRLEDVLDALRDRYIPFHSVNLDGEVAHQSAAKSGQAQPAQSPRP